MTYQEQLLHPKWQKKRLQILDRDNFTCVLCGDTETTLHVHHNKYNGAAWEANEDDLKTLCKQCHELCTYLGESDRLEIKSVIKFPSLKNKDYCILVCEVLDTLDSSIIYVFYDWREEAGLTKNIEYIMSDAFIVAFIERMGKHLNKNH